MYRKIEEYGLIGDMHAVALVSRDGSIDYCAMPHIDSPTVFTALLDDEKGGFFSIHPEGEFRVTQEYIKDTNILSSTFTTDTGSARLVDFMPVSSRELFKEKNHVIHRCLSEVSGSMSFLLEFFPRPSYAAGIPEVGRKGGLIVVRYKGERFMLRANLKEYKMREIADGGAVIYFSLEEKNDAHFDFVYGDDYGEETGYCAFEESKKFWHTWLHTCVGEKCLLWGEYADMLNRSLLALKLLTFQPTGAIAAAATTSLPESLGMARNWDYRFTWIRDASFTLKAFFALGHIQEADSFISWLHSTYRKYGSKKLQIMYSVTGASDVKETTLDHLKGYKGSKPVRIGNGAFNQRQWDIYGEVMDTALRLSDYVGKIDEELWPFFRDIVNLALKHWEEPDEGVWEVRNGPFHFVYSKIMCWVAIDRGVKIAKRYGFGAPIDAWETAKEKIREEVLRKGFDIGRNTFVQRYGAGGLDASLLLLGLMNFLPFDDERIQGTIAACRKNLMRKGFLLRYTSEDGLAGDEGGFLLCNFWLIESMALSGGIDEAKKLLEKTSRAANHLGLFSEEYDPKKKLMLGNFPQAFSHIGYINAVSAILNIQRKMGQNNMHSSLIDRMRKLIPLKVILNKTDAVPPKAPRTIAAELKSALNRLQGAFFNTAEGRVDYDALRRSDSFSVYIGLAERLQSFDPFCLKTDDEKKAFWVNIYNILIIHGVIHFDIRKSVHEVFDFFRRIGYNIGGRFFSPDDIEHGILRGNSPHPSLKIRQFSAFDKRKSLCVARIDPRIHFALVCAASSCPPIEFYDPARINQQLDVAARSFINRKGALIKPEKKELHLSQIFKWYAEDFAKKKQDRIQVIMRFSDTKTKEYLKRHKKHITVHYLPYDWNLNRTLE